MTKLRNILTAFTAVLFFTATAHSAIFVENHGFIDDGLISEGEVETPANISGWDQSSSNSFLHSREGMDPHPLLIENQYANIHTSSSGNVRGWIEQALPAVWQSNSTFEISGLIGRPDWRTSTDVTSVRFYVGYIDESDNCTTTQKLGALLRWIRTRTGDESDGDQTKAFFGGFQGQGGVGGFARSEDGRGAGGRV